MFYPVSGEKLTHVPNVSLTYEMQVVMLSCSGLPRQKEISYRACRLAKDDLGRTLQIAKHLSQPCSMSLHFRLFIYISEERLP